MFLGLDVCRAAVAEATDVNAVPPGPQLDHLIRGDFAAVAHGTAARPRVPGKWAALCFERVEGLSQIGASHGPGNSVAVDRSGI